MQEPFKLKERNPDATLEERIKHQIDSVEFGIASVAMEGLEVSEANKAKMREFASKGLVGSPEWRAFFETIASANK